MQKGLNTTLTESVKNIPSCRGGYKSQGSLYPRKSHKLNDLSILFLENENENARKGNI